ncbi:hypothetical protein ACHAP5_005322 [Fusarium lateritium]
MSAPYDPNQGVDILPKATLLRATRPHSLCSTSRHRHHKKRKATAVYTHVWPLSAVVGSVVRHASVVSTASTAAVNHRVPL